MLYLWLTELNLLMPLDMMKKMKRWGHFHWTHLPLTRDCICHPCHAFWLSTNLVLNGDSKKQALHHECYDGDIDVSADNCNGKWENDSFWCYGRHKEDIRMKINYVPILVENEVFAQLISEKIWGEYEWEEDDDDNCGEDGSWFRDRPIILHCHLFHELCLKYVEKWKAKSSAEEI